MANKRLGIRAIATGLMACIVICPLVVMGQKQGRPQRDEYGESIKSTSEMNHKIAELIKKYSEPERTCDDKIHPEIVAMLTVTAYLARGLRFLDPSPRKSVSQIEFERTFYADVAKLYITLGQTALDKLCPKEARGAFFSVIETYDEPYYASIRERARIGIDDARAMQR